MHYTIYTIHYNTLYSSGISSIDFLSGRIVNRINSICGTIALNIATDLYPAVHKYEIIYAHIPNTIILIIRPRLDTAFCIIIYSNVRVTNTKYIFVAVHNVILIYYNNYFIVIR